jgi:hypothetical protein
MITNPPTFGLPVAAKGFQSRPLSAAPCVLPVLPVWSEFLGHLFTPKPVPYTIR